MGGFFGITSKEDCILDVYFGTDYHSHLGTRRGGIAAYDPETGFQREIHNIENAPFRTKFEGIVGKMSGTAAIGCISDMDPQSPAHLQYQLSESSTTMMRSSIMCSGVRMGILRPKPEERSIRPSWSQP